MMITDVTTASSLDTQIERPINLTDDELATVAGGFALSLAGLLIEGLVLGYQLTRIR